MNFTPEQLTAMCTALRKADIWVMQRESFFLALGYNKRWAVGGPTYAEVLEEQEAKRA